MNFAATENEIRRSISIMNLCEIRAHTIAPDYSLTNLASIFIIDVAHLVQNVFFFLWISYVNKGHLDGDLQGRCQ